MRTLLLPGAPAPSDPAAPSLLDAVRSRLPAGWTAVAAADARSAWRGLRSAAALAFLGGEGPPGPGTARLRCALALALTAEAAGRRLALLGLEATPGGARLERTLLRALAARADLLVLADEDSAQALVEAGLPAPLRVGGDPAWAALARPGPAHDRLDAAVVVTDPRGYEHEIVEPLRRLAATGLAVVVQPWERAVGDATRHADALVAEIGPAAAVLDPVDDLEAARRRFASARLAVIGPQRALIAAAAAFTPVVATGGQAARRLAGTFARIAAFDGDLSRTLLQALDAAPPSRRLVEAEIDAADESFRLLRLLLSEGDDGADEIGRGTRLAPGAWRA